MGWRLLDLTSVRSDSTGQRQRAPLHQLGRAVFGNVLGDHRHLPCTRSNAPPTAGTPLGLRPIRQIAGFRHLIGAQNRHIQMPAAHHRKVVGMVKERSRRYPRAARPDAFGQSALRHQFQRNLPGQIKRFAFNLNQIENKPGPGRGWSCCGLPLI